MSDFEPDPSRFFLTVATQLDFSAGPPPRRLRSCRWMAQIVEEDWWRGGSVAKRERLRCGARWISSVSPWGSLSSFPTASLLGVHPTYPLMITCGWRSQGHWLCMFLASLPLCMARHIPPVPPSFPSLPLYLHSDLIAARRSSPLNVAFDRPRGDGGTRRVP